MRFVGDLHPIVFELVMIAMRYLALRLHEVHGRPCLQIGGNGIIRSICLGAVSRSVYIYLVPIRSTLRFEKTPFIPIRMLASDVRLEVISSWPKLVLLPLRLLQTCTADEPSRIAHSRPETVDTLLVPFQIVDCGKAIFSGAAVCRTVMAFEVRFCMLSATKSVSTLAMFWCSVDTDRASD